LNKGNILIQCALTVEAKPVIRALGLEKFSDIPFPLYKKGTFALVISGVGRVRAAAGASFLLSSFEKGTLLNTGTCGDNTGMNEPGGIFTISDVADLSMPMPGKTAFPVYSIEKIRGIESATLVTSDSPAISLDERKNAAGFGELSDMEGAAIAYVAGKYRRSCSMVKIVSDSTGHVDDGDIERNIIDYSVRLGEFMGDFLREGRLNYP